MDQLLRLALHALRHFIQDIGGLMDPASLLRDWAVFFLQSDPEAKRTIADRQLRRSGKSISADSLYEAGLRSGAWVKVKLTKA